MSQSPRSISQPAEEALEYRIVKTSGATLQKIQALTAEVWADLQTQGSEARRAAQRANIELPLTLPPLDEVLSLRPPAANYAGGAVDLLVTALHSTPIAYVAYGLWRHVVLPNIRDRWGDDAIKERHRLAANEAKAKAKIKTKMKTKTKAKTKAKTDAPDIRVGREGSQARARRHRGRR